jgi:hypothetical protein
MRSLTIIYLLATTLPLAAQPAAKKIDGNRLAYLDELDPYYPHRDFPKLITPQWVGEKDVEAVVVLAIDDMRDPKRYEAFLRPILRRLKEIDGRAALSIMTNQVDPKDPQLQTWLQEGLSLECHTLDHPCPFFKGGFAKAKETYDGCVDLMNSIPGNKPVAFRMPCCDSLNTPSPRFWAEIFNKSTAKGNFLSIDSSVFNVFTSADPELPRELALDDKGQERFKRYLPTDRTFVNTIENYPYPYVIGRLCWEFPCVTPSDWEAQSLQKPNNPNTVRDLKAALDCVVVKKGVFCLVFHPHGWIRNDQVVELIDHAVAKHGKKVKFLNFREAQERLNENLLAGNSLRDEKGHHDGLRRSDAGKGNDNGVRLLDVDNDGYIDVLWGGDAKPRGEGGSRIWSPAESTWRTVSFPVSFFGWKVVKSDTIAGVFKTEVDHAFGVLRKDGFASVYVRPYGYSVRSSQGPFMHYNGKAWVGLPLLSRVEPKAWDKASFLPPFTGTSRLTMRDLNLDGRCELILEQQEGKFVVKHVVLEWSEEHGWIALPFTLPRSAPLAEQFESDSLRVIDVNGDGKLDVVFSNENEYGVYLFTDMEKGWSKKIMAGRRGDKDALPMISRNGTNNGFWVHSGHLWWSNEDTVLLKDHVDRRSIKEMLGR